MTENRETWMDDPDQSTIRLLRLAGTRPPVPAARAERVRAAVHAEWQSSLRRRTIRRRLLFASVMFAVLSTGVVLLNRPGVVVDRSARPATGEQVAVVERIDGTMAGLSLNDVVRSGGWIETDEKTRVALRFSDGTSLRLDAGTRLRPLASAVIELSMGAVYVDTGRQSGPFEVRTALATARDIGTQFEVRVLDGSVRLRVRTGAVELTDSGRSVTGRGGTEITWSGAGAVSRPIAPHGPDWEWTARVAPPLQIEGVALADFLARVGHEHGLEVRYADPALGREASDIILHGSVDGLSWPDAADVAIRTSGLQHRFEGAELLVLRQGAAR
jgi:ferric-dicitrate binding protein FerR (iron transport regulator)